MNDIVKSFQDYLLIQNSVKKYVGDYGQKYNFSEDSIGFLFFTLDKLFQLQEDEIYNAITDTSFIVKQPNHKAGDNSHDN